MGIGDWGLGIGDWGLGNSSCVISIAYSQFLEEDNGYIIIFKNGYNYIFSEEGNLLSNISIPYYISGKHYSLIAYGHSNEIYYYTLIYTDSNNIIFNNYEFNSLSNIINFKNLSIYNFLSNILIIFNLF